MPTVLRNLRTFAPRKCQTYYESKLNLGYTMEPLQHDDWEFVDNHHTCVMIRSRGGSKTKDFVNWLILRVLKTDELWAWLSCKGGQLSQALSYVRMNPFVKYIHCVSSAKYEVWLWSGRVILFGIISTSMLGLRVDGIVHDEFEDLQPKQEIDVFPQMAGMMSHSPVHKKLFLGTLWTHCLLNEYSEKYPTVVRPWDTLPWIVKAGFVQQEIDEGVVPEFEIDLLYRCIPSSAFGSTFPNVVEEDLSHIMQPSNLYGMDFGATDHCVGVYKVGRDIYCLDEWEVSLEAHPAAFDFLLEETVEAEGGGYNDNEKYAAKCKLMEERIGAGRQSVTNKWKSQRTMYARQCVLHFDRKRTPLTFLDVKKSIYGSDGLYKKDDALFPCHWLDAYLHAILADGSVYIPSGDERAKNRILAIEKLRDQRVEEY